MTTTTAYYYAIVDRRGIIVSLHDAPVPAGAGWGHDHELIELVQPHEVGDRIDYDEHGVELTDL